MEQRLSSYREFQRLIAGVPAHMFDIPKVATRTANQYGWYVAHIYPAKNGDTAFRLWSRHEVERRFFLTLHPCNFFLVPGVGNRIQGEDPRVIAFIAEQYTFRYGSIWPKFLSRIEATPITGHRGFGCEAVQSGPVSTENGPTAGRVAVAYRAARLTFKRDKIEPLTPEEQFEVITPMGLYRFTKREFYSNFSNITRSQSYCKSGAYHGATLHLKAQRFRVPD